MGQKRRFPVRLGQNLIKGSFWSDQNEWVSEKNCTNKAHRDMRINSRDDMYQFLIFRGKNSNILRYLHFYLKEARNMKLIFFLENTHIHRVGWITTLGYIIIDNNQSWVAIFELRKQGKQQLEKCLLK